jgi:hypothetical protein
VKDKRENAVKERTDKQLEKEKLIEAQRDRDSESNTKEAISKNKVKSDHEAAIKLRAKTKEMKSKSKERDLKGNLKPMLREFIDKAQLMANNERDLKAAIQAGKEQNTKETIVKAKVRDTKLERREKGISYAQVVEQQRAVKAQAELDRDEEVISKEKDAMYDAETELNGWKKKEKWAVDQEATLATKVEENQATVDKLMSQVTDGKATQDELSMAEGNLQRETAKLETIRRNLSNFKMKVEQAENKIATLKGEVTASMAAKRVAEAQKQEANKRIKYVYTGEKPKNPTPEEVDLYRKFAHEYGLPLPGDAKNPVVADPEANGSPDQLSSLSGALQGGMNEL